MNILLSLNTYSSLTGSELYVYELSRVLRKRKHKVSIIANSIGGEIAKRSIELGIDLFLFFDNPPIKADIIHSSQPLPTAYCIANFPNIPIISTIHSSLSYEQPIVNSQVKQYIFVRPEIRKMYQDLPGKVIYNGVDLARFNLEPIAEKPTEESILFIGTLDHLRAQMLQDLTVRAADMGKKLIFISPNIKKEETQGITHFLPAMWDVSYWTKYATETASIFMGRTTIEGWMCGKPCWIYNVDEEGQIIDILYTKPPENLMQFDIEYMTDRVLECYKEVLSA